MSVTLLGATRRTKCLKHDAAHTITHIRLCFQNPVWACDIFNRVIPLKIVLLRSLQCLECGTQCWSMHYFSLFATLQTDYKQNRGKSEEKWNTGQRKISFKSQNWIRFSFSKTGFVRVFCWGSSGLWSIRQMGQILATRINQFGLNRIFECTRQSLYWTSFDWKLFWPTLCFAIHLCNGAKVLARQEAIQGSGKLETLFRSLFEMIALN